MRFLKGKTEIDLSLRFDHTVRTRGRESCPDSLPMNAPSRLASMAFWKQDPWPNRRSMRGKGATAPLFRYLRVRRSTRLEQKTQQSSGLGFGNLQQPTHSWSRRHSHARRLIVGRVFGRVAVEVSVSPTARAAPLSFIGRVFGVPRVSAFPSRESGDVQAGPHRVAAARRTPGSPRSPIRSETVSGPNPAE